MVLSFSLPEAISSTSFLPYLEDRTVVEWKPKILTLEKGKDPLSAYGTNHTTLLNQK